VVFRRLHSMLHRQGLHVVVIDAAANLPPPHSGKVSYEGDTGRITWSGRKSGSLLRGQARKRRGREIFFPTQTGDDLNLQEFLGHSMFGLILGDISYQ